MYNFRRFNVSVIFLLTFKSNNQDHLFLLIYLQQKLELPTSSKIRLLRFYAKKSLQKSYVSDINVRHIYSNSTGGTKNGVDIWVSSYHSRCYEYLTNFPSRFQTNAFCMFFFSKTFS